ncbi:transforming growth factor beta regulator 1, partial [Nowakowskiella sp. JEL0078]
MKISQSGLEDIGPRRKRRNFSDIVRKANEIPRDELKKPILPIQFGMIKLLSLGCVVWDLPGYHTSRYIWPIGYAMSRELPSMTNPNRISKYIAHITEGRDGPQFQIFADDSKQNPVIASSATSAWSNVFKAINSIRTEPCLIAGSGAEMFGFTNPTIGLLVQELPNSEKCCDFVKQTYEVKPGKTKKVKPFQFDIFEMEFLKKIWQYSAIMLQGMFINIRIQLYSTKKAAIPDIRLLKSLRQSLLAEKNEKLKEKLSSKKLTLSGSKAELVDRLMIFNISSKNVTTLRNWLEHSKLSTEGPKEILVKRIFEKGCDVEAPKYLSNLEDTESEFDTAGLPELQNYTKILSKLSVADLDELNRRQGNSFKKIKSEKVRQLVTSTHQNSSLNNKQISVLGIDIGLRNLSYTLLTATNVKKNSNNELLPEDSVQQNRLSHIVEVVSWGVLDTGISAPNTGSWNPLQNTKLLQVVAEKILENKKDLINVIHFEGAPIMVNFEKSKPHVLTRLSFVESMLIGIMSQKLVGTNTIVDQTLAKNIYSYFLKYGVGSEYNSIEPIKSEKISKTVELKDDENDEWVESEEMVKIDDNLFDDDFKSLMDKNQIITSRWREKKKWAIARVSELLDNGKYVQL